MSKRNDVRKTGARRKLHADDPSKNKQLTIPYSIMTLKPTPLDDLLSHAERYAEFSLRYDGRVPGTFLLLSPTGAGIYVPRNLGDEEARNRFTSIARLIALAHGATAGVMVLESWVMHAVPGVPFDLTLPPSQAPDRQEVVALIGEAVGVQKVRFLPILRTAAGAFGGFGETSVEVFDQVQGRFAQILPTHPPTAEEKARAHAILQAQGMREETPAPKTTPTPRHWHRV